MRLGAVFVAMVVGGTRIPFPLIPLRRFFFVVVVTSGIYIYLPLFEKAKADRDAALLAMAQSTGEHQQEQAAENKNIVK